MLPLHQSGCRLQTGLLIFCFSSLLLAACSRSAPPGLSAGTGEGADRAVVDGIPFYPQQKFQCGPSSLAMLLGWSGIPVTPEELVPELYTPAREGSLQSAIVAGARRHGRIAYPVGGMDELFTEIDAGRPVLVLMNLSFSWLPKWHYAVVYGYDRNEQLVFLHSGIREHEEMSFRVFGNTWSRSGFWGLLVLPPAEMPVRVEVSRWLEAAAGLELAEQWQAAETAFSRAAERWPGSYNAWIGLGNNRFALRDLEGSAQAFAAAIRIRPDSGIAYNNLARVLAEAGRYEEALAAAGKAVNLGGPFLDEFRETVQELRKAGTLPDGHP